MERTVQEAVQQAGEAGQTTLLDWIVGGVTILTLVLLIIWRIRDNQTHLKIEVMRIDAPHSAQPTVIFNVINKSKFPVLLDKPHLEDDAGQHRVFPAIGSYGGNQVSPNIPNRYPVQLQGLPDLEPSVQPKGPVRVKFVIEDGTGKQHVQRFIVERLGEDQEVSVAPVSLPLVKRLYLAAGFAQY